MKTTLNTAIESGLVIAKVAAENPYRDGTIRHARFAAYKNGKSITAILNDERVSRAGLRRDINTGLVKLVKKH
jgi:hypothetical protein